ncbi:hypothetical protein Tco_1282152 [Tanacetum coccineum]
MDSVICTSNDTAPIEFDGNLGTNHDMKCEASEKNMALPPRDQRHSFLKFKGLEYTDADITDFEERLGKIYDRRVHRVLVFDFEGLTEELFKGLSTRMLMEHTDAQGQRKFTNHAWRRLFETRGHEVLVFDFEGLTEETSEGLSTRMLMEHTNAQAESARQISDKGDLSGYWKGISSEGDFLGVAPSYTLIRDPLLRLCHRLIACSIVRRSQAPEKRMDRLEDEVHGVRESLDEQHEVMDAMAGDFSRFTVWASSGISQLLDLSGTTYTRYSETHVP